MALKEKMVNYWVNLYPELGDKDKIDVLLKQAWGEGIEDLLDRIENNNFYSREDTLKMIDDVFSLPIHDQVPGFDERCKADVSYYYFFRPIINYCFWKFYDKVKAVSGRASFDCIVMNTLEEISKYAVKLLVLDVNYMKRAGKLEGETPTERHSYYENVVLKDVESVRELYMNYYEYVRLAMKMTDACTRYCIEILKNFEKDKEGLKDKLNIDPATDVDIVSIKLGSGDKHNGKSVAQVLLSNDAQVLYKPHSLELDRDFANLINWINDNRSKDMLDLKTAECISFDTYSWAFYVPHKDADSKKAINRYFHRAGQLLGIMYMLNGVDCHYENIIASGEYPILIDTETLMHPIINGRENNSNASVDKIERFSRDFMFESVISTGLLPYFVVGNEEGAERVDVGGLSNISHSKYPFKSAQFINANSDDVKLEREFQDIPDGKNCPVYKGKTYEGLIYREDIINGFSAMYDWILENRDLVLAYLKLNFKDTTIRILMRATNIYGRLLETSVHPDFLSDDVSRRVVLTRIAINSTKEYQNIVSHECKSLVENDVPYFTCKLGKDYISCNGHNIDGMIKESPISSVEKKLRGFSEKDKHQQIHFIEDAYRMKESTYESDISHMVLSNDVKEISESDKEGYIVYAKQVADYLLEKAVEIDVDGKPALAWFTSTLKGKSDKLCEIDFATYNFYAGTSGIGQFLVELAKVTGEEKYKAAARKCANAIQYRTHVIENNEIYILGAYSGISGYLLFLYDANKLFNEQEIEEDIILLLNIIEKNSHRTGFYDVIEGDAGCIQVLNYIYRENGNHSPQALSIMRTLVKKISENLFSHATGEVTWRGTKDLNRYCGYAHGSAGIIANLAAVRVLFDTEKIDEMIRAALVFERSFYSEALQNWFTNTDRDEVGNGWCHGSPGILLEKCFLKKSGYTDENLDKEFEIALKRTAELSIGCTNCYCHGDIGNLDIIYWAAELSGDNEMANRCANTYDETLQTNLSRLYAGKSFRGGDVVGLMLGSAGFGYSALRYAKPSEIKSIITLT